MDNEEAVLPFDLFAESLERQHAVIDLLVELKAKDERNARRWAIALTDAEKLYAWIKWTIQGQY